MTPVSYLIKLLKWMFDIQNFFKKKGFFKNSNFEYCPAFQDFFFIRLNWFFLMLFLFGIWSLLHFDINFFSFAHFLKKLKYF